jgi:hypothetical protein
MSKVRFTLNVLAVFCLTLVFSSMAHAQATRTWVSGVGDDANPCSRTAPCKTFAGAISKTAASGEISVLDPGGFGAVTITKSITIEGTQGQGYGSILASATNGVVVNDSLSGSPNSIIVTLRNLSINGAPVTNPGLIGIKILSGKHVSIENTQIFGFNATSAGNGRGISDQRTNNTGTLSIHDVIVRNNAKNGIAIVGPVKASISNVRAINTTDVGTGAIAADAGSKVTVSNSVASLNTGVGFFGGSAGTELNIENSVASGNATGAQASSGATVRLSNTHITGNATGITFAGATMNTYGNNKIGGNTAGNGPFAVGSNINPQ